MNFIIISTLLFTSLIFPLLLSALPEDLEVFTDFEDISGEGEFFIGEEPNRVKMIGFTVETLEDPTLLHSGTKALTLGAGQEGRIFTEKGIAEIEFYVAETTGAGKIEARGWTLLNPIDSISLLPQQQYVITGLPTSIKPDSNPPLQRFVAVNEDDFINLSSSSFNAPSSSYNAPSPHTPALDAYFDGIVEIKFFNVAGKLVINDLGFTLSSEPRNNTVYTHFGEINEGGDDFTVGSSPFTSTFSNGFVGAPFPGAIVGPRRSRSSPHWKVLNGKTGTITFETPAARVQFYAVMVVERQDVVGARGESDGTIQVFDTEDNLLITIEDLPPDIAPQTFAPQVKLIASELEAVGGIARITLSDKEHVNPTFSDTAIDDFGFTPIGAPGFEEASAAQGPSITTQPISQEVESSASVSMSCYRQRRRLELSMV